jgi:hypothetical protein
MARLRCICRSITFLRSFIAASSLVLLPWGRASAIAGAFLLRFCGVAEIHGVGAVNFGLWN